MREGYNQEEVGPEEQDVSPDKLKDLSEYLKKHPVINRLGGLAVMGTLVGGMTTVANTVDRVASEHRDTVERAGDDLDKGIRGTVYVLDKEIARAESELKAAEENKTQTGPEFEAGKAKIQEKIDAIKNIKAMMEQLRDQK